nr:hypothetical protein [uncultured Fluviicola sp.]
MTINPKTFFIGSLLVLLSLNSCELKGSEEEPVPSYLVKSDESSDIDKLGKLIDLEKFYPKKVMFHHTYIETINGNGSAEEPKDDYLQAVLYFDSLTFQKLIEQGKLADYALPNYQKKQFSFPWLSSELDSELENSDANYHGHPDLFFGNKGGKLWFLDQKVLFNLEIK